MIVTRDDVEILCQFGIRSVGSPDSPQMARGQQSPTLEVGRSTIRCGWLNGVTRWSIENRLSKWWTRDSPLKRFAPY
jgi:hypothetical protein